MILMTMRFELVGVAALYGLEVEFEPEIDGFEPRTPVRLRRAGDVWTCIIPTSTLDARDDGQALALVLQVLDKLPQR